MHMGPERLGCVLMEEAWGVWEGGREGGLRVPQGGGCGQTLILLFLPL